VYTIPVIGFWKYWMQKLASLKSECYAIMNKYPGVTSVVQQVYKIFSDIEMLARCTPAKVRERSEWTSIVNSVEENTANFCKPLDGMRLFNALYDMSVVTLNEVKAILKVSAPEG
jgi:hypothetical protein